MAAASLDLTFTPKIVSVLREGYSLRRLRADAVAGLTVAIVALPLAMALGVASGASPEKGLITAIVAGLLISLFGGSRVQIGGPTGAFVVVVAKVIQSHGYDGLLLATIVAGIILVVAGYARLGRVIRYIPSPVVTGFTAGIAVIIASSQVGDFLGLTTPGLPADFLPKWGEYFEALGTIDPATTALGFGSLLLILVLRRVAPRMPAYLIAVVLAAIAAYVLQLPIATIGSRFPQIQPGLPIPSLPVFSLGKLREIFPSALTIAFLAGIEALLSAMVADGMTGFRHRSNQELVAQGIANIASALFGGLPATGAIARTATNVKSGGRTPIAGIIHALCLLVFVLLAAKLMRYVPMAALAAILFVVAWGMSEQERFRALLRMPLDERVVLLLTFGLTVFVDLTVAIGVGVTLASLMFVEKMSGMVAVAGGTAGRDLKGEEGDFAEEFGQRDALPAGVEVFQIRGPLFFGAARALLDALRGSGRHPRVMILRMRLVPYLDASGAAVLHDFIKTAGAGHCQIVLSGVQPQPRKILARAGLGRQVTGVSYASNYADALVIARRLTGATAGS